MGLISLAPPHFPPQQWEINVGLLFFLKFKTIPSFLLVLLVLTVEVGKLMSVLLFLSMCPIMSSISRYWNQCSIKEQSWQNEWGLGYTEVALLKGRSTGWFIRVAYRMWFKKSHKGWESSSCWVCNALWFNLILKSRRVPGDPLVSTEILQKLELIPAEATGEMNLLVRVRVRSKTTKPHSSRSFYGGCFQTA